MALNKPELLKQNSRDMKPVWMKPIEKMFKSLGGKCSKFHLVVYQVIYSQLHAIANSQLKLLWER